MEDPADLADEVADAITSRTGQIWDEAARARLVAWMADPTHRGTAQRWLAGLARDDFEPRQEFELRKPMSDVLAGVPDGGPAGLSADTRPYSWVPRRRDRRPGRQR
jgi:hypothetical protein